ncbi:hypothetical protein SAMN04490248_10318 [Salinihabitans flavidus]|uniref:Cold shock protein, CspA family n=1 Tax=Salinihabitans flavidus TaxID=569882 RepID=A0A1H8N5W9_9RHOB|nr:hypothetical protein [Salinihabitans flavidus]SEO24936.1 hypothetical protein SAMN04490248_10318 [Salinihabitans flavidus]
MLGVVLWSNASESKAVIWCEDHGNLAFFSGNKSPDGDTPDFDAGDLVQFDLSEERHLRYARNPRRIGQNAYPSLAADLQSMTMQEQREQHRPGPRATERFTSAKIIPLQRRSQSRQRETLVAV